VDEIHTKPVDPYRATERAIIIVIVSIIMIHVRISIVLIPIERITAAFFDEVHPLWGAVATTPSVFSPIKG
jgi:hypothetical protein